MNTLVVDKAESGQKPRVFWCVFHPPVAFRPPPPDMAEVDVHLPTGA
jgi:hypothetical protein